MYIPKNYQSLYDYKIEQNEETITVNLEYPQEFNTSSIKVDFSKENRTICVIIPNMISPLAGTLYDEVKSMDTSIDEKYYKITFVKEEPKSWNLIIAAQIPQNNMIDPKSSFNIWHILSNSADENLKAQSLGYLEISAQSGYLPAIRTLATVYFTNEQTFLAGRDLLLQAIQLYEDAFSAYQLGVVFLSAPELIDDSITLLNFAAGKEFIPAYAILGEIYSPFSEINYSKKNPKLALEFFKKATDVEEPLPSALYGLSLFYGHGVEVEKDEGKMEELQKQAFEKDPDLAKEVLEKSLKPQMQVVEPSEEKPKMNIGIGLVTLALGIGFAYLFYRKFKQSK